LTSWSQSSVEKRRSNPQGAEQYGNLSALVDFSIVFVGVIIAE
jgi:hypothetical protein